MGDLYSELLVKKDKTAKADEKVLEVLPDDFSGMKGFFGV